MFVSPNVIGYNTPRRFRSGMVETRTKQQNFNGCINRAGFFNGKLSSSAEVIEQTFSRLLLEKYWIFNSSPITQSSSQVQLAMNFLILGFQWVHKFPVFVTKSIHRSKLISPKENIRFSAKPISSRFYFSKHSSSHVGSVSSFVASKKSFTELASSAAFTKSQYSGYIADKQLSSSIDNSSANLKKL